MLIVKSPVTLVKMMEMGVELLPVNIGNMSNRPGTTQYKKSVSMFPEDESGSGHPFVSRNQGNGQMVTG